MAARLLMAILSAVPIFAQIPGNVLSRVFEIRVPSGTATSFITEEGGEQYIFTANHVVEKLGAQATIELFSDAQWHPLDVRILHGDTSCNDVAVLIPTQKEPLLKGDPLPSTNTFYMGQEIYFLGFPYGLAMQAPKIHMTAPLIKHGYVSALVRCSDLDSSTKGDEGVLLLDGFNNPGFSGGPVVTRDPNDPSRTFKLVAIISSYRAENTPILINGRNVDGALVSTNTGIIVAIPFERALKLVRDDKAQNEKLKQ